VELSAQVCCPSLLLNACQQCIDINRANNKPWVSNRLLIQSQQSACNLHICQLSSTKPVRRLAFRITFKRLPNPWINMQIQLSFWVAGFAFGMQMSTVFYPASLFFMGPLPCGSCLIMMTPQRRNTDESGYHATHISRSYRYKRF